MTEETFTATPRRIDVVEPDPTNRWSIYVIRVDLTRYEQTRALKIGMVGTGTIAQRLATHRKALGPVELVEAWSLEDDASLLAEIPAWRLVEQYEARLQFAPEFAYPAARLRRLNPVGDSYSYEWFENDDRVVDAVAQNAPLPVTLPYGWTLAEGPIIASGAL
jgi:hypothetical protein